MDQRIKKILILIFVILFFIACPTAVFYSRGYRFNFETRKFVKVGALSFRTQPDSCEVYLDGKMKKKTDFLFGNVFIKNLLPKKYNIRIEKEGYHPWEKTLEVKEGWVTESKNIFLFPKNLNFSLLLSDIEDYFLSPDGNKLVLKKSSENGWIMEMLNLERNSQEIFLRERSLNKEAKILDLDWDSNSRNILIKIETEDKIKYFIINVLEGSQIFPLDYLNEIQEVSFNPHNYQEIFFIKEFNGNRSLLRTNYPEKELTEPILENLVAYEIINDNILWLSFDGFLYRSDFQGKRLEISNTEPFSVKEEMEYEIVIFDKNIFLKENNTLYQLGSSKTFEEVADSVKNLKISPNLKRLLISNSYEIWILFLDEITTQPQREPNQKIFLTRFSQEIKEIFWLNDDYLIFNTGDKIKISEIDDRDKINIIEIGEFKDPKIFWNKGYGRVYNLSNNNLSFLDNLLP